MSLTILNSRWALVFLTSSFNTWLVSLDSSQVTRLSSVRTSFLIHARLQLPLLDFLLIRMDHSWAWRRWFLYNNQLSHIPLPFRGISLGIFPRRSLKSQRLLSWTQGLRPYFEPSSDPEAVLNVHIPNPSFLHCKYQVQQSTSSCCLFDYLLWTCWQCTPEASRTACALLLLLQQVCFQGLWPLPMVWRKHHLILKSVCRTVVSPGLTTYSKMDSYFSVAVKSSVFLLIVKYSFSLCDWSSGKFSSVSQ